MPATMQKLQVPTRTLEGSCEFLLQRRRGSLLGIGSFFCGFQLSALVRNRSVFRSSLNAVGQPISSVANALVREVHVPIKAPPKGLPQEWTLHSRRAFSRSGCKKPYGTAPHVDCLRAPDSEADGQLGAKEMTLHVDSPVVEAEVSGAVLAEAPGERETASGKEETPGLDRDLDSTATGSSGMDAEGYIQTLILKCLSSCVFLCLFSVYLGFVLRCTLHSKESGHDSQTRQPFLHLSAMLQACQF